MWRVNLPRGVKSIPNLHLTPRILFPSCQVGSGKSTLVTALIGELDLQEGSVASHAQLGYVPQHALIVSGTIRENILFGPSSQNPFFSFWRLGLRGAYS